MRDQIKNAGAILGAGVLVAFMMVNAFGGIISAIWLLILGEWSIIVIGFIASLIMPWLFSLALLPSMAIAVPMLKAVEKGRKKTFLSLGFINALYTNLLILMWVYWTFNILVMQMIEQGVDHPILLILWAYTIAISPLLYMAKGEDRDATGTHIGLMLAVVWFMLLTLSWFAGWSESVLSLIFWILMIGTSWLTIKIASLVYNPQKSF